MARVLLLSPLLLLLVPVYYLFLKSSPPVPQLDLEAWWGPPGLKNKQDDSIKPFKIKFKEVMARVLLLSPLLLLLVPVYYLFLKSSPPVPQLDLEAWWGPPGLKNKQDDSIKPFKIKFKEVFIQDLKERIKNTRTLTPPLEGVGFKYGFNSQQVDGWLRYWAEEYPFAERQAFLNQHQQYKTNIQGLNIHFISVRPEVPAGVELVPVLLLHGWPGSVREFYEAIPYLTAVEDGRDFALDIIIPSLPGFGFSDAAVRPGLGAPEVAVVLRNLMHRLGYSQFYVQGGDLGSLIGGIMATLFPKEVLGFHTNLAMILSSTATLLTYLGSFYPPLIVKPELASRMYPMSDHFSFLMEESGYFHIQATKPDTIGVAISDSPAGLLAYNLEKFSTGTNPAHRSFPDGGFDTTIKFTKEQLIDNLMYYWAPNAITTAIRFYSESFNKRAFFEHKFDQIPTKVPTWALQAKYEMSYQPPCILKLKFPNLLNATVLYEGGHFLAFELPQIFAEDVVKAIGEFRKWRKKNVKTEL